MSKTKTKTKEPAKQEVQMVTVECICKNVHLGGGNVLRAYRDSPEDNWGDGDVAQIPHADAVFLEKRKQVKIL